jgi:hypothetical protein
MARAKKSRAGHQGGARYGGQGRQGGHDDRWDPLNPYPDPRRDLRDLYEDQPDPAEEDYIWPETGDDDED